ncbi:MAG: MBL fold metallo-hydrolase [Deltaproteobacteria bacterium]|nr:MBL fold metallo-hydrolase [Deltaproteobacteria bacterium]
MKGKVFLGSLIVVVALGFVFSPCLKAGASETKAFTPKMGNVFVKEISGVKFILQDTVQNAPHNRELKLYVESLGKPLERIIISHSHPHHWVGLEMFYGAPVYATGEVIHEIREQGNQMLLGLKKRFGEKMIPYAKVVIPSFFIYAGEERIDGVLFHYIRPNPKIYGNVLWIEFPEQKTLIHHHLAYVGMHAPMPPIPPRIEMLKKLKGKGYQWIMPGHAMAMGPEFFDRAIEYYNATLRIVKESPDVKTAKEKLIKAYPKYGAVFLLDMMLPAFYKKR